MIRYTQLPSRRINPILLHTNNLIRVIKRAEPLALLTAILHASIILLILLAEFCSYHLRVDAAVDSAQSINSIGLEPAARITAVRNATASTHKCCCSGLTLFGRDLTHVPDLELRVVDCSRSARSEKSEKTVL
jgi:hypothetical protein